LRVPGGGGASLGRSFFVVLGLFEDFGALSLLVLGLFEDFNLSRFLVDPKPYVEPFV
jgi:hypothetical protein